MEQNNDDPIPELMEAEDQLFAQLREEFRVRFERHLQEAVVTQESQIPEIRDLIRRRTVELSLISTFGVIRLQVLKGYSPTQKRWIVPIRRAWRLANNQRLTPSLQRKLCCTAVATGSFEKAAVLAGEWGCTISDDAIHSCVVSLGGKAVDNRDAMLHDAVLLKDAIEQNKISRIYLGVHWDFDATGGETVGKAIAAKVVAAF